MGGKLWLKIAAGCLVLSLIGGAAGIVSYAADDLSEYEERQKELDKEAQKYQSVLDQTASDISEKERYKEALLNKITVINEQIANGREQISSLEQQITEMQTEIDSAKDGISDRIDVLKKRLKAIYLSGETTSIEIILGAKDFEDFLDKLELVSYMSNSDQKMISKLQGEIKGINEKKESLSEAKTALDEEQKKLDERQKELQELINENEELLGNLYEDNASAQDHLDENSAARKEIEDAIMAYYADKAAQEEASRIASEARKALEQSRLEAEAKKNTSSGKETDDDRTDGTTTSRDSNDASSYVSFITPSRPVSSQRPASSWAETSSRRTSSVYVEPSSQEPEPEPSSSDVIDVPEPSADYVWPVPGHYTLSSQWNEDRNSYNHGAIDISDGSIMNAAVVAAQSGTVILSNDDCPHNYGKGDDGNCGCGGGYGNYLMIDHGDGKATLYAHLTSLTVASGSYVQQGQVIGYVGTTGWSSGPHLHFETRLNGVKYNPMTEYPNY